MILGLGVAGLGLAAAAAAFWHLLAGIVIGVPTLAWLLKQLWGELELEWECRRPVHVEWSGEQVIQDLPQRRAIEASRPRVPIIATAEVIEVKRA